MDVAKGTRCHPFLFILGVEIICIMIRNNRTNNDIIINEKEHKLSEYADDTLFFLDGTSKSLTKHSMSYQNSLTFLGLNFNLDETHVV